MSSISTANFSLFSPQIHAELLSGDWEGIYKTSAEWLEGGSDEPVATFFQNMACLFVNPPSMIRNKRYLTTVKDKDWKPVLDWFSTYQSESDKHNPYFQALSFIIAPQKQKKDVIESALQEHPSNAELLFFQALVMADHTASIEKLKRAAAIKPGFAAALYMIGIYSLELKQVQDAETYLNRAAEAAPDFLEAHYQLGNLYFLYIPDSGEKFKEHFEKVIALDPDGEAGKDAKKVMETNSAPQYGQRIASRAGRTGGMSIFTILGISILAVWLFAYPIAAIFKIQNPLFVGVFAGMLVFFGLYSANNRRK